MLLWSAIAVLVLALTGLTSIIVLDIKAKGWPNWVNTLREWQNTLGTVAGFLSAAGALMLSTAIQNNAEVERAERASFAIGQALAYEVERLIAPVEQYYSIASSIDPNDPNLAGQCRTLFQGMAAAMIDDTPVYDAVLGHTLDFGDFNLAIFTRIYAYFVDFRNEISLDVDLLCNAVPADRIDYILRISRGGFAYYQLVVANYPGISPLQESTLASLSAVPTSAP